MGASRLSRSLIAETALEMLDAGEGLSSLSMRKLGAELGVEAMSLYHYVENKAELLDAVLTLVLQRIELPEIDPADWESAVRAGATSVYEVLESSRAAFELITGQPPVTAESLAVSYFGVSAFTTFGLSMRDAMIALHTTMAYVFGHVASRGGSLAGLDENSEIDLSLLKDPALQEYVSNSANINRREQFDEGLDVIIAGLRARYHLK